MNRLIFGLFLVAVGSMARAETTTGLAIAYEYLTEPGVVPEGGCRLRLESSDESVLVTLPVAEKFAVVDLKAGTWKAKRLGCGVGKVWTLDGISEVALFVKDGSVAYAGSWILELPKIRMVKRSGEAAEETSSKVRFHSRGVSLKALKEWKTTQSVINAFNGKPIDMHEELSGDGGFKLQAAGLKEPENRLASLGSQLTTCADRESTHDPIRAGTLEWKVKYTNGTPMSPTVVKTAPAFRQEFLDCIRSSISKSKVENQSFELTVKY